MELITWYHFQWIFLRTAYKQIYFHCIFTESIPTAENTFRYGIVHYYRMRGFDDAVAQNRIIVLLSLHWKYVYITVLWQDLLCCVTVYRYTILSGENRDQRHLTWLNWENSIPIQLLYDIHPYLIMWWPSEVEVENKNNNVKDNVDENLLFSIFIDAKSWNAINSL